MKSFFSNLTQAQAMLLVGLITVVLGGIVTGYFQLRQVQIPIEATQTAQVKPTLPAQIIDTPTPLSERIELFIPTDTATSQETKSYKLFFDGSRVGYEPNWTCRQALRNLSWNIKQYPNKEVEGWFDDKKIDFAGTGYELFFDCERVGHEPQWTSQQALKNLLWNIKQYPNKEVEGWFNGEQLIP